MCAKLSKNVALKKSKMHFNLFFVKHLQTQKHRTITQVQVSNLGYFYYQ